jgi:hypothetical protein
MPDESAPPITEEESFIPPGGQGPGGGPAPSATALADDAFTAVTDDEEKRCPGLRAWIAEAARLRAAAQQADARIRELEENAATLTDQLAQAREAIDHVEKRHQIDMMLVESDTIDIESARLLAELAVQQMPGKDIRAVIDDLRRRKPALFRARPPAPSTPGPMSPAPRSSPSESLLESAAEEAATTGDRNALLRYLRARRGG